MPVEYEGDPIHYPVAVSASDLHSCGINVPPRFILAPERRAAAATRPFLFLLVFQSKAPQATSRGDEVIPPGISRIHLRTIDMNGH